MGKTVQKYGRRRRTPTRKDSSISNGRKQEPEPEVLITSSDSQPKVSNSDPPESEPEDEEEPKTSDISNQTTDKEDDNDNDNDDGEEEEEEEDGDGDGDGDGGREGEEEEEEEEEEKEDVKTSAKNQKKMKMAEEKESPLYTFAMNRIQRIVRSEAAGDVRLTEEAVFLINKASEKFLELVCQETYACCVKDHKNYVAYKHVSSVVSKKRRYDFLSDFVPEKIKAEDALEERKSAGL